MRTTKNPCMRKLRNRDFRNQHVPKHCHTNFRRIPRGSWILSLYVGKFHHLSATCRLMVVKRLLQIVSSWVHKMSKPKIYYSKLTGTNTNKKRSHLSCQPYLRKLIYIYMVPERYKIREKRYGPKNLFNRKLIPTA